MTTMGDEIFKTSGMARVFGSHFGPRICLAPETGAGDGGERGQEGGEGSEGAGQDAGAEGQQERSFSASGAMTGDDAGSGDGSGENGAGDEGGDKGQEGAQGGAEHLPENWRELMAGEDKKLLGTLKRFKDPATFAKSFAEARETLSRTRSVELPESPTEAQLAEYRKAHGIPDKPDGYEVPKLEGFDWNDEDKALFADVFHEAHGANIPAKHVQALAQVVADARVKQLSDLYEADKSATDQTMNDLNAKYGPEYRSTIAGLNSFLDEIPEVGAKILDARLPDGTLLANVPGLMDHFIGLARDVRGDSGFTSGDTMARTTARKEEIQKIMKSDMSRYYAEGMDKEYAQILADEERRGARR